MPSTPSGSILSTTRSRTWVIPTAPHILGLDVAGVVDSIGSSVREWQPGDRVFYHGDLSKPGGFAEFAVTTAHTVARIPDGMSFVDAAALPCAGLTAYHALHRRLHVRTGQPILVHAGAGGVGGFAIQLAAHAGLKVLTTCSASNSDYVRDLEPRSPSITIRKISRRSYGRRPTVEASTPS